MDDPPTAEIRAESDGSVGGHSAPVEVCVRRRTRGRAKSLAALLHYSEEKHPKLEFEEDLVPTKSISVEDTVELEVLLAETETMIRSLAAKLWSASRKESGTARTVVRKAETFEELTDITMKLREKVDLGPDQRYRLVGIGLSNFREPDTAAQSVLSE